MLLEFKVVADSSLWVIDTDKSLYARISEPVRELHPGKPPVEEFGNIVAVSPVMELYRFEGREPKTEGPGCGLTSVAILVRIVNSELEIGVKANVEIEEPVCVSQINNVRCEVLGHKEGGS